MGGVDKLDFLIVLSKKWTQRIFTHRIDLGCTLAWLEYKRMAISLGVPKKDILDLLGYRAYVAEVLIKSNFPKLKKRTTIDIKCRFGNTHFKCVTF